MARINIEACWWSDLRRSKLVKILGSEAMADGAAVRMWKLAQDFWKNERQLVPVEIWAHFEYGDACIQSGLASVEGSSVYVRGSSEHHEWIFVRRENGSKGGKLSAEARRKKTGTAQPSGGRGSKPSEATELTEAKPNQNQSPTETSYSYSSSSSFSKKRESTLEDRMNPENQVFLDALRELEIISPTTKGVVPKIRERFESVDAFSEWVQGVAENKNFRDKETKAGKKAYLTGALLREIGAL